MEYRNRLIKATLVSFFIIVLSSFFPEVPSHEKRLKFPFKKAGLTERQAAAHLLSRFTFGATPGQIDSVVNMVLETWFLQQLNGAVNDDALNQKLASYNAIHLSNAEVLSKYPPNFVVVQLALKDSAISKDSVANAIDKKAYNDQLQAYRQSKGLKPEQELYKQFISEHILRATYSRNQLQEVLTDFWFNHFNVSFTKSECALFIPSYERDIIRPNVLGKFDELLLASAKSPAMLYYLDNFTSVGVANVPATNISKQVSMPATQDMMMSMSAGYPKTATVVKTPAIKNIQGLNENYAREVMELHTLGVDGGYTQQDVTQAAKILTGWTIYPISNIGYGSNMKGLVSKIGENNLAQKGFVREGDFLFTPNRHDTSEKTVMNNHFYEKGGYEEGVKFLEMLAHHPSTAQFICKKLATRFCNDNPPLSLVNKMTKTFIEKGGDIRQVLLTMVAAPEFWSAAVIREKIKSPFEVVISAVRSLDADVKDPYQLFNWMSKMGQKIFYYQAPTGFPDRGQYWINTGSLLNRMNFGLALTSQKIPGVTVDLLALNQGHEPESADAALAVYSKLLLPERNPEETIKRLTPFLNDPALFSKVAKAALALPVPAAAGAYPGNNPVNANPAPSINSVGTIKNSALNSNMLSQVAGIIIGSPEFQRR